MSNKANKKEKKLYYDSTTANVEKRENGEFTGHIFGLGIPYNTTAIINGWFEETILPGAIDEEVLKDVAMYTNHETNKIPLARSRRGNGSLKLSIEEDGVHYDTTLDIENNTHARMLCSAIARGDINGTSFIMHVAEDEWDFSGEPYGKLPKRTIKKIDYIQEISPVNYPAYDSTNVSLRSADAPDDARAVLEKAKTQLLEKRKQEAEELEKAKVAELKAQIYKQYGGKI